MDIEIHSLYITLGQLLKMVDLVGSGGETKAFLSSNRITVNGEAEQRRGRKLYAGDQVNVLGKTYSVKAMM